MCLELPEHSRASSLDAPKFVEVAIGLDDSGKFLSVASSFHALRFLDVASSADAQNFLEVAIRRVLRISWA